MQCNLRLFNPASSCDFLPSYFMPSGRTHDFITFLLVPPTAMAAYYLSRDWTVVTVATAAMVFGGLMFGPDLDIRSRQYARWGPLRFLWWPYRMAVPHRSRLSHSILLGTWLRVIYFLVVVTLAIAIALYARDFYLHRRSAGLAELSDAFSRVWEVIAPVRRSYSLAVLIGLWAGATSHIVSDVLGSFFKSVGRSI